MYVYHWWHGEGRSNIKMEKSRLSLPMKLQYICDYFLWQEIWIVEDTWDIGREFLLCELACAFSVGAVEKPEKYSFKTEIQKNLTLTCFPQSVHWVMK